MPQTYNLMTAQKYDVIVIGSGAAGMLAAIRAHDLGLSSIVLEKARQYGGTSALSGGGIWIPCHHLGLAEKDSPEDALMFLKAATQGQVSDARLESYIAHAPAAIAYLESLGIPLQVEPGPDYLHELAGSLPGRCVMPQEVHGRFLGDELNNQREQTYVFRLFNRYSLGLKQALALAARPRGWQWTVLRMLGRYWLDLPWRFHSRRDRTLTMGAALMAGLRKAMLDRRIPLVLDVPLMGLVSDDGSVRTAVFRHDGRDIRMTARRAILLATGGFEHNQEMRDKYHLVPTSARATPTPAGANYGDGIRAGQAVGAGIEFMEHAWWFPTALFPSLTEQNLEIPYLMTEYRHPYSIMVNRLGNRFTNEFNSYDRIGLAMIEDSKKTNANVPCWMIFDTSFRQFSRCGPIMPTIVMPDWRIPAHYWNKYIYRADSVDALAAMIAVDPAALSHTVQKYNAFCVKGADQDFGRGSSDYDRYYGDSRVKPSGCLGALDQPPYYAVRMELGDLGTKGGLTVDERWRVVDDEGLPIPGLYATGNTAGSIMAGCYPGAGGTLGPATTGAYIAIDDIASERRNA